MTTSKRALVILNPYSNRWKAGERWPEAEAALIKAGVDFDLRRTEKPGDGISFAEEGVKLGYSPIISAGGDGATGEVLNGLHRAELEAVLGPLGILPLGTANDLAHNLDLPLDLETAARTIAAGHTRRIDLGKANEWVFHNNSAVGLEPVVTQWNVRMVRFKGVTRYLVAALRAIASGPHWECRMKWDDGEYLGPISLVSVGNCPVTGGLFRMAPAADPEDGRLTFVYAYAASRLKMLSLLPRAINGSYVTDPACHQHHTTRLVIELTPGSPIQMDGELRSLDIRSVEYSILPGRLDILSPNLQQNRLENIRSEESAEGLRAFPKEFLNVPNSLEPAQPTPTEVELEEALEIRSKFLFPQDKLPYMVDMVRAFRLLKGAKKYIEIGTYDKGNLAYISRILAADAHIIDVDIAEHPDKKILLESKLKNTQTLTSIVGDSTKSSTYKTVKQALGGELADAIFIDGNHVAEIVMSDYAHYSPLVKPGGFIFFHDIYWYGDDSNFGAAHAIAEIDRLTPVYAVFMDSPIHRFLPWLKKHQAIWGGIGIIQRDHYE